MGLLDRAQEHRAAAQVQNMDGPALEIDRTTRVSPGVVTPGQMKSGHDYYMGGVYG
jgi:hypothetical protein